MQFAFVERALQCRNFVLALGRVLAFGSLSTARLFVTHGAAKARFFRGGEVLLLGAVLILGRAKLLNTSCA
jgi:uncharacterized membrane protein